MDDRRREISSVPAKRNYCRRIVSSIIELFANALWQKPPLLYVYTQPGFQFQLITPMQRMPGIGYPILRVEI